MSNCISPFPEKRIPHLVLSRLIQSGLPHHQASLRADPQFVQMYHVRYARFLPCPTEREHLHAETSTTRRWEYKPKGRISLAGCLAA